MRKNIRKQLSMILTTTAIINTLAAAAMPVAAYAHTANERNNAYYVEVSGIAESLTANFKDETERKCCYDTMMTGVFGEHYRDWGFRQKKDDLICVLSEEESSQVFQGLLFMYGTAKYLDLHDGNHYYCMLEKVALNEDGINAQNYDNLKAVYQAAEMLKAQTAGMNVTDKARHIHDYIVNTFNAGDEANPYDHCALRMISSGTGVCSAYTTLFTIFGRYCGLDVDMVVYKMKDRNTQHCFNTVVMENGETRSIDVLWDDVMHDMRYFMETMETNLASHPR